VVARRVLGGLVPGVVGRIALRRVAAGGVHRHRGVAGGIRARIERPIAFTKARGRAGRDDEGSRGQDGQRRPARGERHWISTSLAPSRRSVTCSPERWYALPFATRTAAL